jgi:selenide,water dikinase
LGYGSEVVLAPERSAVQQALLTDPQTSGGLLVSCDAHTVDQVLAVFERHGFAHAAVIGDVVEAGAEGPRLFVA